MALSFLKDYNLVLVATRLENLQYCFSLVALDLQFYFQTSMLILWPSAVVIQWLSSIPESEEMTVYYPVLR